MSRALTLVVCGAPLASRVGAITAATTAGGWTTSVVGTPASAEWIDAEAVERATGSPARFEYRKPFEAKSRPEPDALVVCPATFNTVNKMVAGASDNYALGVIAEALGTSLPVVVAPMVSSKLWGHPTWVDSLETLTEWNVALLDIQSGEPGTRPVASGSGEDITAAFQVEWVVRALAALA